MPWPWCSVCSRATTRTPPAASPSTSAPLARSLASGTLRSLLDSSSCSSQLQFNNLLSSQAKPYPEAASDVSTVVVTMAAALLAAVTMTMYTVCVQDVPTSDLSYAYNYSALGQLPTVQTQDLCAFSYATLMMLNNCLLSNTKKMMFKGEEVTPVVMLHVLLATLSMHRHIVQISCLVNV